MPLVSARNISKSYGQFSALSDVSFDIEPGVTGLLGANGAGKTTMLGMIIGLHQPTSGTLEVLGHEPWTAGGAVRERLGYAPEHHTLPPEMPADEFVRHVAELHGLPKVEAATRASDALWLVDLGEERFRPMGTMSTGQRQRVKLAQAIAHDPQLILLDEPTDGLDPMQRDTMLELIRHVSEANGINVILSSHLLDEVEKTCDSVVILGDGKTLTSGRLDDLRSTDSTGVTFELEASPEQVEWVLAYLLHHGLQATASNRHVTVAGTDASVYDAARDACVAGDIGIVSLGSQVSTLEDVFLEQLG